MIQKHERCYWRHRPTGGFGHLMNVPCLFLGWGDGTRVLVEVQHEDGATTKKLIDETHLINLDRVTFDKLRREAVTA